MKKRNGSGEREKGGGKEELVLFDMGKKEEEEREQREKAFLFREPASFTCATTG